MGYDNKACSSSHAIHAPPPLPREDTPLLSTQNSESSVSKTVANILIAMVGAGVLGLPYTFKRTGWLTGTLMIFSVAFLTYHCMMLLVYSRRKLETVRGFSKINSYGDLGFAVCGRVGRAAVDIMIVLSQAGFCASYLIFVANSLVNMINNESNKKFFGFISAKALYIWACLPFQLGLNSVPTLTHLAPLSIFADVVDLGAMGIVMVEDVIVFLKRRPALEAFGGFSAFLYGLGVAVYSFEGIGMVLPLELEARNKEKFGRALGWCMGLVAVIDGSFGLLGYMAYGEKTRDIITTNLGRGVISSVVQIGLSVNLYFTFPLMMNPVYEIVERRVCEGRYSLWVRWVVVLAVSLVAMLVPNFTDFLSLVGSSVCCALGYVLPTLFHIIVFRGELSGKVLVKDGVILIVGVVTAISGTYISLLEILSNSTTTTTT